MLPTEHDGRLHWTVASNAVVSAHRRSDDPEAIDHATRAMENALLTEHMLQEDFNSPAELYRNGQLWDAHGQALHVRKAHSLSHDD